MILNADSWPVVPRRAGTPIRPTEAGHIVQPGHDVVSSAQTRPTPTRIRAWPVGAGWRARCLASQKPSLAVTPGPRPATTQPALTPDPQRGLTVRLSSHETIQPRPSLAARWSY